MRLSLVLLATLVGLIPSSGPTLGASAAASPAGQETRPSGGNESQVSRPNGERKTPTLASSGGRSARPVARPGKHRHHRHKAHHRRHRGRGRRPR